MATKPPAVATCSAFASFSSACRLMVMMPGVSRVTSGRWFGRTPICPSGVGSKTSHTSSCQMSPAGVTISNDSCDIGNCSLHVEGTLGLGVVLPLNYFLEAFDCFRERHKFPRNAGEDLGDVEGLGEKALNAAGPSDHLLVGFGQLFHAEDSNDVLQVFISLQNALHLTGDLVMLLSYYLRRQNSRGGIERINGRINAEFDEGTGEHDRRIKVGEGGGRSGVGDIVGRHEHGLHGGNRAFGRRGNPFLEFAHLDG